MILIYLIVNYLYRKYGVPLHIFFENWTRGISHLNPSHSTQVQKAKSRKKRAVFKVKGRKRHGKYGGIGLNNWSISKSPKMLWNQVSGRVSVPCWHAIPVTNAPWKPLVIGWMSSSVSRLWNRWKVWSVGKSL